MLGSVINIMLIDTVSVHGIAEVRVAHIFYFSVLYFCFVCLRPMHCVLNVNIVSGMSIPDFLFGFL